MHDATVIQEVRKRVGCQIDLRADANQSWTFEEAMQFGSSVKDCHLQYIEVYSVIVKCLVSFAICSCERSPMIVKKCCACLLLWNGALNFV